MRDEWGASGTNLNYKTSNAQRTTDDSIRVPVPKASAMVAWRALEMAK